MQDTCAVVEIVFPLTGANAEDARILDGFYEHGALANFNGDDGHFSD